MTRIDDVLGSLDVRTSSARQRAVPAGGLLPLPDGAVSLAYVVAGEIAVSSLPDPGCELDIAADAAAHAVGARTLIAGDALLWIGRRPLAIESPSGADVMLAEMRIDDAAGVLSALPGYAYVTGFARMEPAAAALASSMGAPIGIDPVLRSGDPVICRMMASTVLMSLIRAWMHAGCAPQGWPARSADPFLSRVVDAIHDDPGRDWTLEQLASLGAMSRSVFAERFREAFGQSPAGYVTQVRMTTAKSLLGAGRSVSATSRELGYGSDEGFSRAFRRHTGVVPSAWRRQTPVPA